MLRTERHDRVQLLVLDRPDARNAFNTELYEATTSALRAADADDDTAAVVITGAGTAFSAGIDLAAMSEPDEASRIRLGEAFTAFLETLATYPKPLVAAVNGAAVGIGFTMLLHCDLVVVGDGARLRGPFTALGLAPEGSSSLLLPARIGWQHAAWILFTSEWITAERALELGIAWRHVTGDALVPETIKLAQEIAAFPIPSLKAVKRLMLASLGDAVLEANRREQEAFGPLVGAPANIEAISAFFEKRPPDYSGIPGA